jgi:hypothetical protein
MVILPQTDGNWRVIAADGTVIAEGLSNVAAWQLVDKYDDDERDDEQTRRRVVNAFSS